MKQVTRLKLILASIVALYICTWLTNDLLNWQISSAFLFVFNLVFLTVLIVEEGSNG